LPTTRKLLEIFKPSNESLSCKTIHCMHSNHAPCMHHTSIILHPLEHILTYQSCIMHRTYVSRSPNLLIKVSFTQSPIFIGIIQDSLPLKFKAQYPLSSPQKAQSSLAPLKKSNIYWHPSNPNIHCYPLQKPNIH
jgi:hypothetical protein